MRAERCHIVALLLLIALPALLQLPALCGWLDVDPMRYVSGLSSADGQLLPGYPWIDPNAGFHGQALGKLAADSWLRGEIPWWNPYSGIGMPLAAEMQPAALFLPFVLLLHFGNGVLLLEAVLQIIAGVATYALLRRIGLTRIAALTGGVLFEFNGTFALFGSPIVNPLAFLPLLLLGIEIVRAQVLDGRRGNGALVAIAVTLSLYAGFPETAYLNGLFAAAWTLIRFRGMQRTARLSQIASLAVAVTTGLLCSLPATVPFLEYLQQGHIGLHGSTLAHARLPVEALLQGVAPWIYGPIFAFDDPHGAVNLLWRRVGGYFTVLPFACLVVGASLAWGRRWAPVYTMLSMWMLVCLARTFAVPGISQLVDLVPLIDLVAFGRYAPSTWQFAGIVLVALTIDALSRGIVPKPRWLYLQFALVLGVVGVVFTAAATTLEALLQSPASLRWFLVAAGWMALTAIAALALFRTAARWRHSAAVLATLLMVDAVGMFAVPLLSGATGATDASPSRGLAFLKANLGLQRVYTMGPMQPNYGAYFRIPQINYNHLPVPERWVAHVTKALDPETKPIFLTGTMTPAGRATTPADALRQRLPAYEALAVKYIVTPPGVDPFHAPIRTAVRMDAANEAYPLTRDQSLTLRWPIALPSGARLKALSVLIGNYRDTSDGTLVVQLCDQRARCASAKRRLATSHDNQPFSVAFEPPFSVDARASHDPLPGNMQLTVRLSVENSTRPVAVWLYPVSATGTQTTRLAERPGMAPVISLVLELPANAATRKVHEDKDMVIHELLRARSYFSIAHGRCRVDGMSRTRVDIDCLTPARLVRRELMYPGWSARADGRDVPVMLEAGLFQAVDLPAGHRIIDFSYRPTHSMWIGLGFGIGLLLLLFQTCDVALRRFRGERHAAAIALPQSS